MRIKVTGNVHPWVYLSHFKDAIKGTVVDKETDRNVICWVEYETDEDEQTVKKIMEEYELELLTNAISNEKTKNIKDLNEPMTFYELSEEKQNSLLNWISKNFICINSINKYKTSLELKELFREFPISNGEFKGAMVEKCGFRYDPHDGVNWYFNISRKSPAFLENRKSNNDICPKCGGKLVVRNSIYGTFKGCENYPKCKFTTK